MPLIAKRATPSDKILIRVVYEYGVEAVNASDGWVISSVEPGRQTLFATPAAVTEAVQLAPCLITERLASGQERSLLLRLDAKTPFGLGVTELFTGVLESSIIWHAYHIGYLVGSVAYHCQRLAELYVAICRQFAAFSGNISSEHATFGYQMEPYYEFDAAVTAARRAYDVSRYLLWRRFGGRGSIPSSFARTLAACSQLPEELKARLETSWREVGKEITEYRDCLQHYVPVDFGLASASMENRGGGLWSVRILIPDNPEARSKEVFTYGRGLDALSYCRSVAEELLTIMSLIIDSAARPSASAA
jgi:hypothetical protein